MISRKNVTFFRSDYIVTEQKIESVSCTTTMYFFCIADEDKWKTEARTEGGAIQEYMMPYQNLLPTTKYTFRVMAYSKYGISLPATSQESVRKIAFSLFQ